MKILVIIALLISTPAFAKAPESYANAEYGLYLTFPAGGSVCTSLSGDHPHGFYARYARNPPACHSPQDGLSAGVMGVYANYNIFEYTSLEQVLDGYCDAPRPDDNAAIFHGLSFRKRKSLACVKHDANGNMEISVAAFSVVSQPGDDNPALSIHPITYVATLITRPQRLKSDLARFRAVLDNARIVAPE